MIKYILYLLISGLFILDWLFHVYGIGIRQMTWIPEFISIIIAVLIPFRTAVTKESHLPIKYTFLLIIYIAHIGIGFLLNDVSGWTMLSGVRIYTKFIPIFLVGLIFPFSEQEFKKLVLFVLLLAMIQLPVVLWQRFIAFATSISGDPMGGTLGHSASGVLSIFLLIIISFLVAFYFKEEISLPVFILAMAAAFIPTTLNETKITFILLPVAFIFPAMFIKAKRKTIFRVMLVAIIFFGSFFVLKGIYDYFQQKRWGYGIQTFITMPGRLEGYSRNRLDPIKHSFTNATKDPRFLFFGRGAGNVSEGFTKRLSGKYVQEGKYYGVSGVSFPKMIWELGIFGAVLFFLFPFFIFRDAAALSKKEGFLGAFSLGMLGFSVFFSLSILYTSTMDSNLLIYLFFMTGGYIVRQRKLYADEEEIRIQSTREKQTYIEEMSAA
ncbi:MAG: hypothetical protein DRH26_05070 [Deltaproteobacteria bacterium]|nr:MAG: hypothetical protein DRH26_05070 [Deltaproteobacteria bacterium]